jgi:hypothetical protein
VTTEIEHWIGRFLAERGPAEANIAAKPELGRIAAELNTIFWREAERVLLRAAAAPDRAVFAPDERLLLDLGLLDLRVLPGAEKDKPLLLREIYAPGRRSFLYFSEWMLLRLRQFVLYGGMGAPRDEAPGSTRVLRDLRSTLYLRLSPLFRNLPGFNQQAVQLFLSGKIDETLDALAVQVEREPDQRLSEQRRQLLEIRTRLIIRAREQARSPEELALFDQLREADELAAERRAVLRAGAEAPRALSPQEREKFVQDELRFVKSALWLGIMGSGLARTWSVLLTAQPRTTKADLEASLALAKECDPALPETGSVVIAPYVGGGFYDWDRDSLIVPLVPTREPGQAILQALANYRMLLDKTQQGGKLRRGYEQAFRGGEDFNQSFVRDYKDWVLGVGRGFKGALEPARYAFFREQLGPGPDTLFGPREWAPLTPQETEEVVRQCRAKVQRAEAAFEDYYRLAIAAARGRDLPQADRHLESALALSPMDGRALMARGWLAARAPAGAETARLRYSECMALAAGTLWSVFAAEELQKL